MAQTGVWVQHPITGELIPKHSYHRPSNARSNLSAPMIISDTMDHTWNPVNGKRYDSKSQYYKAVRQAGCEIIGNEKPSASARPELPDPANDIKAVVEQVEARTPKVRKRKRK